MNVKRWALFFLLTLCVNYVTATLLGGGGGLLSEGGGEGGGGHLSKGGEGGLLSKGEGGGGLLSKGGEGGLLSKGEGEVLSKGGGVGGLLSKGEGEGVGGLLSKGEGEGVGGLLSKGEGEGVGGLLSKGGGVGGILSKGEGELLSKGGGGGGGLLHGGSHGDGRWTSCSETQHKFFKTKFSEIRKTSRFGSRFRLGARETDKFKLTNVKAGGLDDFIMGPDSWYRFDENGVLFLRFSVIFKNVRTTSLFLCPEGAGGIVGKFIRLVRSIIGLIDSILGGLIRILLEIAHPPLTCDVVVKVDQEDGCSLENFRFQKPVGQFSFLGRLARHQRRLLSFHDLLRVHFDILFREFFHNDFSLFLHGCIRKWNKQVVRRHWSRHHTGMAGIERSDVGGGGYSEDDSSYEEWSYEEDYEEESYEE